MLDPDSPQPDPEPLARGGLAHAVLRDTLQALREQTGSARVTTARLALARRLLAAALARQEPSYRLSAEAARVPGLRRKLQADLERYLAHAAEQVSPLEPAHLELGFGFEGEPLDLPALDLGDGVRLRGRIDRVDVGPRGEAVLFDYKGASVSPAAKWLRGRQDPAGAVRTGSARAARARCRRGLLPAARRRRSARARRAGPIGRHRARLRPDRSARTRRARGSARARTRACRRRPRRQARAGAIEARPQTCAYGGGCAHPAICRSGR